MGKQNALNRAFEKAFAHTATKETLIDLLACLGEELSCDRISIFELNQEDVFDNTYEWCRAGIAREKDLLQKIHVSRLDSWKDRLLLDEIIGIADLELVRSSDPDVYDLFHAQGVSSLVVSKLAFHGKSLGFFVLENPDAEVFTETQSILPGMRYILSSLVYSDHLVRRLERIGYTDRLTGTGNRLSLQEHLESLMPGQSLGLIYCDTIGWNVEDARPEHLEEDQKLLRTGQVLCDVFGYDGVFRLGGSEFLVVLSGEDKETFETDLALLRNLFAENDLLVAIGEIWQAKCETTVDALIRKAHVLVYEDKKLLSENQMAYRKAHAKVRRQAEKDLASINLLQGDTFFRSAEAFLSEIFDQAVLTAVIDINYFKLYNDIFGRKAGNVLLEEIADSIYMEATRYDGIAGYLGGDNFCLMLPASVEEPEDFVPVIEAVFSRMKYPDGFTPAMGIYISFDRQETMITMYDRALTALAEIKGSYMEHYRFYDAGHFQHLRDDKILLMDIKKGLPTGEFVFYLQPQVHERTGKIVGAEALVRWQKGDQLIPPTRFIPLLEKTGYIFTVDCYVWEEVVRWIRSLIDRGLPTVQCSVNVSRVDFYFTDIAEYFIRLLEKYDVSPALLGIEITESAFTDNTDLILEAVGKLHEAGFRVLMDDFGSGSSSLSMLHTMQLDVLKTDVRFMSRGSKDNRAVSIVESVITMAHMIGMLVVTEGVETPEQRDNLIALGDNYAQGFFFYHPMPVKDFEALIRDPENLGKPPVKGGQIMTNHIGFRDMIREGMVSDTLLDNIIGPAAVYKETQGRLELIQLNDAYCELTGVRPEAEDRIAHIMDKYQDGELTKIAHILHGADAHPLEGSKGVVSLCREDGTLVPVDVRIFLLYSCEEYKLYLSTISEHGAV